jgi:hypothetical protein
VQSRSQGLTPLPRRLLILVDGKRSGKDLAVFVEGHAAGASATKAALAKLPDASTRSVKDLEKARNFMMNTINAVFQQNTRLTLMKTISECRSTEEIRRAYPKWVDNMRSSVEGAKRLPEFHDKLFAVL